MDVVAHQDQRFQGVLEFEVAETIPEETLDPVGRVFRPGHAVDGFDFPDRAAVEDPVAVPGVETQEVLEVVPGPALWVRRAEPGGEQAAGRGPRDHVEILHHGAFEALLERGEHDGGHDAPDAAAVDAQDPYESVVIHR